MELPRQRPDPLSQRRLDVHVDVFERRVPGDSARRDVFQEGPQTLGELLDFVGCQDPCAPEPPDVGDRAPDVVGGEGGVDLDRAREIGDARIGIAGEPPAPGPHRPSVLRLVCYPPAQPLEPSSAATTMRHRPTLGC